MARTAVQEAGTGVRSSSSPWREKRAAVRNLFIYILEVNEKKEDWKK